MRNDDVLHEAAALLGSLPEAVADKLARGERPLAELAPQRVLERLPNSREELNRQFESTFGLLVSKCDSVNANRAQYIASIRIRPPR